MPRGQRSGISLSNNDASLVLGMIARGDRHHDIAGWFGVNQGRIKEVQDGSHGSVQAAPSNQLPPSGPPGLKGRRLRADVRKALVLVSKGGDAVKALEIIATAADQYDKNEP